MSVVPPNGGPFAVADTIQTNDKEVWCPTYFKQNFMDKVSILVDLHIKGAKCI